MLQAVVRSSRVGLAGVGRPVPPVAHPFVECVRACVTRTISVSSPSLPQSSRLISHKMRPDLLPLQICCHRRRRLRRRRPPSLSFAVIRRRVGKN